MLRFSMFMLAMLAVASLGMTTAYQVLQEDVATLQRTVDETMQLLDIAICAFLALALITLALVLYASVLRKRLRELESGKKKRREKV
jgi:H+/Cl- antiporter ClcA